MPLHDLQKMIYHMEKEEVRTATRGTVIEEEGEKNVSSMILQVSMARDRRTNNPSASTFIHTKNRSVILLVNLRSWYEHPQRLSVHYLIIGN